MMLICSTVEKSLSDKFRQAPKNNRIKEGFDILRQALIDDEKASRTKGSSLPENAREIKFRG